MERYEKGEIGRRANIRNKENKRCSEGSYDVQLDLSRKTESGRQRKAAQKEWLLLVI